MPNAKGRDKTAICDELDMRTGCPIHSDFVGRHRYQNWSGISDSLPEHLHMACCYSIISMWSDKSSINTDGWKQLCGWLYWHLKWAQIKWEATEVCLCDCRQKQKGDNVRIPLNPVHLTYSLMIEIFWQTHWFSGNWPRGLLRTIFLYFSDDKQLSRQNKMLLLLHKKCLSEPQTFYMFHTYHNNISTIHITLRLHGAVYLSGR